ncbi:MAG: hypothetical protein PHI37_05430 [Candidatus Gracilibacteria bacterium]|nr:hypothetical protein [Candidatus Gracilibacteria bacterium]
MVVEDINSKKSNGQGFERAPDLSQEVSKSIEEVLQKVEQVIDLGGYDIIKKYFSLNNLSDYFDFYYVKLDDFKSILSKSDKLLNFYKEKTGESISKISSEGIIKFAKYLGIERPSYSKIKISIKSKLQKFGVTYLNEFQTLSINNFRKYFSQDNEFKYLIFRLFDKSITNIDLDDYKKLGEKLELDYLEGENLKSVMKNRLKLLKIDYLDDLISLSVRDFDDIVRNDLLIGSYFLSIGVFKSHILKEDIEKFGIDIGLKKKEINKSTYILSFLKYNKISNFSDLKYYPKTEIRALLWEDKVCREILEGFGLTHLQDFRVEHLKRFARYVGLDGVPKDFELDEERSKTLMLNILKQNGIECIYSLKLYGLKGFRRIFKQKDIGDNYQDINTFVQKHIGKTIPNLSFDDLETIGNLLGLELLDDLEHKKKLDEFLLKKGVFGLEDLCMTNFKRDNTFWFNPNLRYFLDKTGGPTDVKKLRRNHVDAMKYYINGL